MFLLALFLFVAVCLGTGAALMSLTYAMYNGFMVLYPRVAHYLGYTVVQRDVLEAHRAPVVYLSSLMLLVTFAAVIVLVTI